MLSDTESSDSDNGIRFKTASTRNRGEESYGQSQPSSSSHNSNGNRYESNWKHRDDRCDSKDHRSYSDRRSGGGGGSRRRSESRDRKRTNRSSSRDRQLSSSNRANDRRRSRSRDRTRETDKKHQPTPHKDSEKSATVTKIPKETPRSVSVEKQSLTTAPSPVEENSIDKHKVKKSKHKKHKRSKRDDSSKERTKSLERETIQTKTPIVAPVAENNKSSSDVRKSTASVSQPSSAKMSEKSPTEKKSNRRSSIHDENNRRSSPVCGPKLPPHLHESRSTSSEKREKSSSSSSSHGHRSRETVLGPSLPPPSSSHQRRGDDQKQHSSDRSHSRKSIIGPSTAPQSQFHIDSHPDSAMSDISETEDDYLIGPLPDGVAHKSEAHLELEKRALELKLAKFTDGDSREDYTVRDEWMLELPEVKIVTDMGLTARQFRTKERPEIGDRSGWTDTPKERERKLHHTKEQSAEELRIAKQKDAKTSFNAKRDAEQEEAARKHRKRHKRDESLLDIHQKKLKRKKEKEEDERPSRRPFSRECDLKVNRFDQAQKNAILKKAQLLDTRFSRGETKYL